MFVIALVVALAAFIGFLSLVGSPSEVETVIGLVIASIVFVFVLIAGWRSNTSKEVSDKDAKIAKMEKEIQALKSRS